MLGAARERVQAIQGRVSGALNVFKIMYLNRLHTWYQEKNLLFKPVFTKHIPGWVDLNSMSTHMYIHP